MGPTSVSCISDVLIFIYPRQKGFSIIIIKKDVLLIVFYQLVWLETSLSHVILAHVSKVKLITRYGYAVFL